MAKDLVSTLAFVKRVWQSHLELIQAFQILRRVSAQTHPCTNMFSEQLYPEALWPVKHTEQSMMVRSAQSVSSFLSECKIKQSSSFERSSCSDDKSHLHVEYL